MSERELHPQPVMGIPYSDWNSIKTGFACLTDENDFNLTLSELMKVVVYRDEDYFMETEEEPVEMGFKLFEPRYTRCCKINQLTKKEVELLQGTETLFLYMALNKLNMRSHIKIAVYQPMTYNLKDLKSYMNDPELLD